MSCRLLCIILTMTETEILITHFGHTPCVHYLLCIDQNIEFHYKIVAWYSLCTWFFTALANGGYFLGARRFLNLGGLTAI